MVRFKRRETSTSRVESPGRMLVIEIRMVSVSTSRGGDIVTVYRRLDAGGLPTAGDTALRFFGPLRLAGLAAARDGGGEVGVEVAGGSENGGGAGEVVATVEGPCGTGAEDGTALGAGAGAGGAGVEGDRSSTPLTPLTPPAPPAPSRVPPLPPPRPCPRLPPRGPRIRLGDGDGSGEEVGVVGGVGPSDSSPVGGLISPGGTRRSHPGGAWEVAHAASLPRARQARHGIFEGSVQVNVPACHSRACNVEKRCAWMGCARHPW